MKSKFALAGVLTGATPAPDWRTATLSLTVIDKEGVHALSSAQVGDVVLIDAAAADSGSWIIYRVTAIGARTGNLISVSVAFDEPGNPPDVDWCIGATVLLTRRVNGLLSIPSPTAQSIPDKLAFVAVGDGLAAIATRKSVAITARNAQGQITQWATGGDSFVATYTQDGLSAVVKNGQPFMTITYAAGQPAAVNYL